MDRRAFLFSTTAIFAAASLPGVALGGVRTVVPEQVTISRVVAPCELTVSPGVLSSFAKNIRRVVCVNGVSIDCETDVLPGDEITIEMAWRDVALISDKGPAFLDVDIDIKGKPQTISCFVNMPDDAVTIGALQGVNFA